jgi:hypothetical protein
LSIEDPFNGFDDSQIQIQLFITGKEILYQIAHLALPYLGVCLSKGPPVGAPLRLASGWCAFARLD